MPGPPSTLNTKNTPVRNNPQPISRITRIYTNCDNFFRGMNTNKIPPINIMSQNPRIRGCLFNRG